MLGVGDIVQIAVEILTGKPPRLRTPEWDALREQVKKERKEILNKGGIVDVPCERIAEEPSDSGKSMSGDVDWWPLVRSLVALTLFMSGVTAVMLGLWSLSEESLRASLPFFLAAIVLWVVGFRIRPQHH